LADHDVEDIRGRNVVAVISYRDTYICAVDTEVGTPPERIMAPDPQGRFHKVHHKAGNPSGTYEDDSPAYWDEITAEVAPAGAILVFGNGNGKANASHHWITYIERHHRDVAAKVVADVRIDIDHLDEEQVLRLAQIYFGEAPERDIVDSRRGASS
jgi:hypothetical protein